MNLYDRLRTLQVLPNAYAEWADYRQELTDYILRHTQQGEELVLFGIGRSNDVDLARLAPHYSKLRLLDRDKESLAAAVKQYGLVGKEHVQLQVIDFVGLAESTYRDYADALVAAARRMQPGDNLAELKQIALSLLTEIAQQCEASREKVVIALATNVVAVGVHSQLINMLEWIWQAVLQAVGGADETVREAITQLNEVVTKAFNALLCQVATKQLIIGCEKERVGRIGAIAGAYQGMQDLAQRTVDKALTWQDTTCLLWPLDAQQGVSFWMEITAYQKG